MLTSRMGLPTYVTAGTFRIVRKMNSWSVKQRRRLKVAPIRLFLMLYVFHQSSAAQSGTSAVPEATPGRPTVSAPAALTPVGYLQFENGTLLAEHSTEFSNRFESAKSPSWLYIHD